MENAKTEEVYIRLGFNFEEQMSKYHLCTELNLDEN